MFGWEFPPHISGGLGTACYGLTKGLSAQGGVDIIFVAGRRSTGCSDDGRYAGTGVCQHSHRLSTGRYSSQAYSPEHQSVNLISHYLHILPDYLSYVTVLAGAAIVDPGQPVIAAASKYDFCKSAVPAGITGKIPEYDYRRSDSRTGCHYSF